MRLIDADALIAEWCDGCKYLENGLCDQDVCGGVLLMKETPTIDAVPVVRCKDCKHFVQSEPYDPCECMKWTVKWGVAYTSPDGFCSYGEKRDE
jgi:hypothetical protein